MKMMIRTVYAKNKRMIIHDVGKYDEEEIKITKLMIK